MVASGYASSKSAVQMASARPITLKTRVSPSCAPSTVRYAQPSSLVSSVTVAERMASTVAGASSESEASFGASFADAFDALSDATSPSFAVAC